jgi:hypothetical protein
VIMREKGKGQAQPPHPQRLKSAQKPKARGVPRPTYFPRDAMEQG